MFQKLKGESGILRKKFSSLQKEMEDQKEGVRKQQAEVTKLNAVIRDMEKDIIVLKKEIQERDDTIQDKVCQCSSIRSLASAVLNPPVHINTNKKRSSALPTYCNRFVTVSST